MESHHNSLNTLGRAIRYRRWRYKMTIQELSKESKVCYRSLIDYENGLAQPTMRNLLKICKVLDMQITLTPNEDIEGVQY